MGIQRELLTHKRIKDEAMRNAPPLARLEWYGQAVYWKAVFQSAEGLHTMWLKAHDRRSAERRAKRQFRCKRYARPFLVSIERDTRELKAKMSAEMKRGLGINTQKWLQQTWSYATARSVGQIHVWGRQNPNAVAERVKEQIRKEGDNARKIRLALVSEREVEVNA